MDKAKFLGKVSLFANLNDRNLNRLSRVCTLRTYRAGDFIVRQDDEGVGLFVIIRGKVKIVKKTDDGREIEIATHGSGEFIGELAVLDGAKRTASVIAAEESECLVLASWDFTSVLKANPKIALDILPVIVRRFRETNEQLLSLSGNR
ncbi:MAG: cyclic nucleotide-binding domain-containing protein [Spirochaetales bacterium]|jgi:CRP/FNR family transcriptional regulator, cyclic AMP receptor protein|nr:cyclic nucleotide-binding domain-containing protein [Spirochaetales bacterium]